MKTRFGLVAVAGLMVLSLASVSVAQSKKSSSKKAPAKAAAPNKYRGEVSLVGVKLMDDGLSIINRFGSPDDIQAIGGGGGATGPVGGGARGGGGAPGVQQGGGGAPGGAANALGTRPSDFDFGNDFLAQGPMKRGTSGGPGAGDGGGPQAGGGGGAMNPDMGGGNTGAADAGARVLYTRWIYKRGPSRYGFVLNKFNKVVQIEAIGMNDGKVSTSRGVGFGASFATLQKKYGAPDGYEINGDQLVVRYLVTNKVAFRMSRLGENKPHVVTGVVVAGGKM